jgi:hypothetical protein
MDFFFPNPGYVYYNQVYKNQNRPFYLVFQTYFKFDLHLLFNI